MNPQPRLPESPMPPIISYSHWVDEVDESDDDVVDSLTGDEGDDENQHRYEDAFQKIIAQGREVFGTNKWK